MKEFYSKYSFLINLSLVIVTISAGIALLFYLAVRPAPADEQRETGGPGQPSHRTISVLGWDNTDQYESRLSRIMDISSQTRVIKYIETDYLPRYQGDELLIYGYISNIESDNATGVTSFQVQVGDSTYRAVYNLNARSVNVARSGQ